jgi:hypothetical protein
MTQFLQHPNNRHHKKKNNPNKLTKKVFIDLSRKTTKRKKRKGIKHQNHRSNHHVMSNINKSFNNISINKIKHHANQTQKLNIILKPNITNKNKTIKRDKTPEEIEKKKREILQKLDQNKETSLGSARGILKGGKNYVPRIDVKKTRKKILERELNKFINDDNDNNHEDEKTNIKNNILKLSAPLKTEMKITNTIPKKINASTIKNIIIEPDNQNKSQTDNKSTSNINIKNKNNINNTVLNITNQSNIKYGKTRKVKYNELNDKKLIKILNSDGFGLKEFNIRKEV